jgi:hypothetical protein
MVKEIPIIFSTPMVRAITEGRKTQTRRIVKYPPSGSEDEQWLEILSSGKCPYGSTGDLLWVRETVCNAGTKDKPYYLYKANGCEPRDQTKKWSPSIHMPKAAARIWLEVKHITVQLLHDITEEDALDEGIRQFTKDEKLSKFGLPDWNWQDMPKTAIDAIRILWIKINGEENWTKNPWVWAIEFKVLSTTGKPEILKEATNV